MKLSKAATIWIDYHRNHSKKNTLRSYQAVIVWLKIAGRISKMASRPMFIDTSKPIEYLYCLIFQQVDILYVSLPSPNFQRVDIMQLSQHLTCSASLD